jgi:hypothetical protein
MKENLMDDRNENVTASIIKFLDEMLLPEGYACEGLTWRKDGEGAIIAIALSEDDGILEMDFCAWLSPGGKRHLESSLGDLVPEAQGWRLARAFHLELDYAESPAILHYDDYTDDEKQAILRAMEPESPLTMEWRRCALQDVMTAYILPLFARIEAGEITDQLQIQAGEVALDLVAEVRRLREANTSDDEVIDFLFEHDVLPAIAWEIIEEAYQLKSWQGGKLAERIDEKWAMRRKAKA